jgi:hypothetical protein
MHWVIVYGIVGTPSSTRNPNPLLWNKAIIRGGHRFGRRLSRLIRLVSRLLLECIR